MLQTLIVTEFHEFFVKSTSMQHPVEKYCKTQSRFFFQKSTFFREINLFTKEVTSFHEFFSFLFFFVVLFHTVQQVAHMIQSHRNFSV